MRRAGTLRLLLAFGVMAGLTFVSGFTGSLGWEVAVNQAFPLLVLGAWLLVRLVRREPWPDTALNLPLVAWLGTTLLAAAAAIDPRIALESWIKSLLWPTLGFWLVLDLLRHGWARALWGALYLVAAVVALLTALEYAAWYLGGPLPEDSGLSWWAIGGAANPIPPAILPARWGLLGAPASPYLAAYWAMLIPPLLGLAWDEAHPAGRRARRIALLGTAGVGVALLLLTFSRSGLLGLAVAVPLMVTLKLGGEPNRREWLRQRLGPIVAVMVVLAGLAGVLFGTLGSQYFGGGHLAGDEIRLALWQRAVELFLAHPLLGIGLHNFAQAGWPGLAPALRRVGSGAHNQALSALAEHGALGALAGLWLLVAGTRLALRRWRAESQRPGLLAGVVGALAGFLTASLTADLSWWPLWVPYFVLAAWAVGGTSPPEGARQRRWPWWLALGLLLLSAAGLAWSDRATADLQRAVALAHRGEWRQAATQAEQALAADRHKRIYQLQAAEFWARAGLESDDRAALVHAAELYAPLLDTPIHPLHRQNYAWVLWALGDEAGALAAAQRAAEGSTEDAPLGAALWLGAGALHEAAGQGIAALEAYAHAVVLSPGLAGSPFWAASEFRAQHWAAVWEQAVATWSAVPRDEIAVQLVGVPGGAEALDQIAAAWLAAEPDGPLGLEAAALAALVRGAPDATEAAGALCQAASSSPGCFLARGWAALDQGDEQAGRRDLQTAIFVAPNTPFAPVAAWLLAGWHWAHGERQEAWPWVQRFTPPPPPFDTRDSEIHSRRAWVDPLPSWPAIRALPTGIVGWEQARQWLQEPGFEYELETLCQTAQWYDPFLELCAAGGGPARYLARRSKPWNEYRGADTGR